jgi:nitrogen-specific signal transduction histidine kinase
MLIRSLGLRDSNFDKQIKYLIYSTCIGFFGAAMNFLLWFNIPFPPVFNVLIPIYVLMVAFAILKYRLMDIEIIIRKGLLYSLLAGLLSAFYLSAVFIFGNYLGGRKSAASILFTIFSIVFFSLIFQPLRDRIQELIDKVFFKGKYDYQKTLRSLSLTARSIAGIDELVDKILNSITETIKINKAAIYVIDKRNNSFVMRKAVGELQANLPADIIDKLKEEKETIIFKEAANISKIDYAILFPILSKERLVGILCLGEKLSGDVYSDEDIDLLTTLCNQMGVSIENAMLYEDAMESQKHLYQADKLATLGTLAAGLAHEIKNPIAAIKGFSQMIGKSFETGDKEAIKDFEDVVPRQLDKINDLVERLLKLSKPVSYEKRSLNINIVLEDIIKLTEKQAINQKVQITKELNAANEIIGDPDQLTQAFLNLILNGIQSMPDGGILAIKTLDINDHGHNISIEIKDTGVGIPEDKLDKIFDPFWTTKEGGMGLGLAVTKKIIDDHKGKIDVESEIGKGTIFQVRLGGEEYK